MTITELITKVQDQSLSKEQLEDYFSDVSILATKLNLHLGELEKEEAIFIESSPEKTNAAKEMKWDVTESGQKLIEYKRKLKAVEHLIKNIKSRIYSKL